MGLFDATHDHLIADFVRFFFAAALAKTPASAGMVPRPRQLYVVWRTVAWPRLAYGDRT